MSALETLEAHAHITAGVRRVYNGGQEAGCQMRAFVVSIASLALLVSASAADAKIAVTVDKDSQTMTVAVDGVERYRWPVSTGNPSYETPNGSFQTFRMEEDHFSKEFDDAPMPHSIFFTKQGHAIHGTTFDRPWLVDDAGRTTR